MVLLMVSKAEKDEIIRNHRAWKRINRFVVLRGYCKKKPCIDKIRIHEKETFSTTYKERHFSRDV